MVELVYRNGIYITGTVAELRSRLAEHQRKYDTLKQLLEELAP